MRTLCVLAFCVVALVLPATGRADEPKKSSGRHETESPGRGAKPDAGLLVGKWVRTDKFEGTTMEYFKGGTYLTTMAPKKGQKPAPMPGTWRIEGDRIVQTLGP